MGYIVTSETYSFGAGNQDVIVLKLDSQGNIQWDKTFGGSLWEEGIFRAVETPANEYVITGKTHSFGAGNNDLLLLRLSAAGAVLASETFGGGGADPAGQDQGSAIATASDQGFVIGGSTTSFGAGYWDALFIKFDSSQTS